MDESRELTPEMVLWAYRHGFFPMADHRHGHVGWYSPDPRAILPFDRFHIPRSLRRRVRQQPFQITRDAAFAQVIKACAGPRPYADETWINDEIIEGYQLLHQEDYAHSVEAWLPQAGHETDDRAERRLVGGLYGVSIGAAFFGESMFSAIPDASKLCLVHLVDHLRACGFRLLDTQMSNPHMEQFGVVEISREAYLHLLAEALSEPQRW